MRLTKVHEHQNMRKYIDDYSLYNSHCSINNKNENETKISFYYVDVLKPYLKYLIITYPF